MARRAHYPGALAPGKINNSGDSRRDYIFSYSDSGIGLSLSPFFLGPHLTFKLAFIFSAVLDGAPLRAFCPAPCGAGRSGPHGQFVRRPSLGRLCRLVLPFLHPFFSCDGCLAVGACFFVCCGYAVDASIFVSALALTPKPIWPSGVCATEAPAALPLWPSLWASLCGPHDQADLPSYGGLPFFGVYLSKFRARLFA